MYNRVTTLIRTQLTHTCLTEFHQTPAAITGEPVAALRKNALGAQLRNHVHPNPPRPVPTLRSSLCRSFRATLSFTVFWCEVVVMQEYYCAPVKVKLANATNCSCVSAAFFGSVHILQTFHLLKIADEYLFIGLVGQKLREIIKFPLDKPAFECIMEPISY